jgi:hypothetical protein
VDWIDLAKERDRWWAVVNAVMDLWVPYNAGNFWAIYFKKDPTPYS